MKYKLLFLLVFSFILTSCKDGVKGSEAIPVLLDDYNISSPSLVEPSECFNGYVVSDFAIIKELPTYDSETVTTLFRGRKIDLIALIDDWYSFKFGDTLSFINSIDVTLDEINSSAQSFEHLTPKGEYHIENVPLIAQNPDYPTGCESVSAVMALNFLGEEISVDEFIDNFLEKDNTFYTVNGTLYGPDPNEVYVGNPREINSLGCMSPVIEKALIKYLGNSERVKRYKGASLESLCAKYIDNGVPVILWATIAMIPSYAGLTWETKSNGTFSWPKNEHCMLMVGYDDLYYYMNDPYRGKVVAYPKQKTEIRYKELGSQAVVIEN